MMTNKPWIALLLGVLCFAAPAQAQDVNVQMVPLAAEAQAWLVESHDVPMVTVKMAFRDAGASSDIKGKEGRSTLLASLLNEGAGELDALAFNQKLEDKAIHLSFSSDDDLLTVNMETLSENVDEAFQMLVLALSQPRFDDDAVARMKAAMHSNLRRMEEQPRYVASKALSQAVYGDHPYVNPIEGTHEGIDAITKDDLRAYLTNYVTTQNLLMSVVGDIDAAGLQALVDKYFGVLPSRFNPAHAVPPLEVMAMGQTETIRRSIPQTVLLFAGKGMARDDKDFYVAYVLNHLLGGGTLTSKLGDEIREKRGMAYYAYSQLQVMDHGSLLVGGFGTRNDQAAQALSVLMDTLRATQNGEISQAEVDEAKSYITGAWPLALSSNDGIASMLLVMQRFRLGTDYLAHRNDLINAVTRDDIIRVAKTLLQPQQLTVVGVGDPAEHLANHR
jgi:zinc protease